VQIRDQFEIVCIFGGVIHLIPYLSLLIVVAVGREDQKVAKSLGSCWAVEKKVAFLADVQNCVHRVKWLDCEGSG